MGRRKYPVFPEVERSRVERQPVKRGAPFGIPEKLLREPGAKIGGERDAGAAITHAVMDAIRVPAQMGQRIECIRYEAAPTVADLRCCEFGEDLRHLAMQWRSADCGIGLPGRNPAAKEYPLPVFREPKVADRLAGIAHRAVVGDEALGQPRGQGLGRNDVTSDGDDPSMQPRGQTGCVAIGRDDHLASMGDTAQCPETKSAAVTFDSRDRTARYHSRAGFLCPVEKTPVKLAGMKRRVCRVD